MPASQSIRRRRRKRGDGTVKLNITSMIDMFTLMVVFLLINYSAQGQLVTPAKGLKLPVSSADTLIREEVTLKIAQNSIMLDTVTVVPTPDGSYTFDDMLKQQDLVVKPLFDVLEAKSKEMLRSRDLLRQMRSGGEPGAPQEGDSLMITIQGDTAIPYRVLSRVFVTASAANFGIINLAVYKKG